MKTYRADLKKIVKSLQYPLLAVLFLIFLSGCQGGQAKETRTGFYLNTVISVTIYGNPSDELFDGCMELAEYYDNMLSRTTPGSDIWNINHSNGSPVTVHEETCSLLNTALSYAEMSDGLVDPTIGTLSILWNFGDENQGIVPSESEIADALSHVNYKNVVISGSQVSLKDDNACLDLGFIAKGYIADKMKEYLVSNGVKNAIINLGGNVSAIGSRLDGTPYKVGVQKPFAKTGTSALILEIKDKSVVSSGNYERYFEKDGIIYHHILSTENGYPSDSGLSGVTVISEKSVDGDALSTFCFLLGYEKGAALINSLDNVDAVFITTDGTVYQTFDSP